MILKSGLLPILMTLFVLAPFGESQAQENRIESEFKLAVPDGQEEAIWAFLQDALSGEALQEYDSAFTSIFASEVFHDVYFDNPQQTISQNNAGVRFRERYVADTLSKRLLQLKLATADTSGVARQEIKFNPYKKVESSDPLASHPFWRYVKPSDRDQVNLQLGTMQIGGNDLAPTVKLKQDRRRAYVSKSGLPFLTATLDRVSYFYYPYPAFTELELELNEILYTEAGFDERAAMEGINRAIRDRLFMEFPDLVQDQTPKYNRMLDRIEGNKTIWLGNNLMYIILGLLVATAIILFLRNR